MASMVASQSGQPGSQRDHHYDGAEPHYHGASNDHADDGTVYYSSAYHQPPDDRAANYGAADYPSPDHRSVDDYIGTSGDDDFSTHQ
jgi:hypothetical protein